MKIEAFEGHKPIHTCKNNSNWLGFSLTPGRLRANSERQ